MSSLSVKTQLTGGTAACVDRNTTGMKVEGNLCNALIAGTPNILYSYKYSAASTATADGVNVIIPYGQSAGTAGRWILFCVGVSSPTAAQMAYIASFTSDPQAQLNTKAPLASAALTGTPTAPTATAGTGTTQISTCAFVKQEISTELNATGGAPMYACRAKAVFNGTGTVAIRSAGNVTSVTDVGTGTYTVNITTAMSGPDFVTTPGSGNSGAENNVHAWPASSSTIGILCYSQGSVTPRDSAYVSVAAF